MRGRSFAFAFAFALALSGCNGGPSTSTSTTSSTVPTTTPTTSPTPDAKPFDDTVRLVFFDAEDGGDIPDSCDTPWLIGSEHYAHGFPVAQWSTVRAMVLVDLVGDANLSLPRERSSTKALQDRVYAVAGGLGYASVF